MKKWAMRLSVAALAILIAVAAFTPSTSVATGALSQKGGDAKGLYVRGWTPRDQIESTEKLPLRWIFENHSAAPIMVDSWTVNAPGFALQPGNSLPFTLDPGALETVDSEATPLDGGSVRVGLRYRWHSVDAASPAVTKAPAGAKASPTANAAPVSRNQDEDLTLGTVQVLTRWGSILRWSTPRLQRLYGLAKDFTIPLLLAWLAYLFNNLQRRRDEAIADARAKREQRNEVWSAQIPRFREYAEKHYFPILMSIRLLRQDFRPFENATRRPTDDEAGLLLYRLLIVLRRMRFLRDEKGGIFLQIRLAESLFQNAWFGLNHHCEVRFTIANRDKALNLIKPGDSFAVFQNKLQADAVLQTLRTTLADWIKEGPGNAGFQNCMELANIMRAILSFEANRPFDNFWYDLPDDFELRDPATYQFPLQPADTHQFLKDKLPEYKKDVENYIRARIADAAAAAAGTP